MRRKAGTWGWVGRALLREESQRRRTAVAVLRMRAINKSVAKLCTAGPRGAAVLPMNLSGASSFLLGDPFVGAGFQKIEGEGSAFEHFLVEFADVEFRAQILFGEVAGLTAI